MNPEAAESGDRAQRDVNEQHPKHERSGVMNRRSLLMRLGDIGKRDRDGGQRDRVEAEQEPGREADHQGSEGSLLRDRLKLFYVHFQPFPNLACIAFRRSNAVGVDLKISSPSIAKAGVETTPTSTARFGFLAMSISFHSTLSVD